MSEPRTIDLDRVAEIVRDLSEGPCYVEQTGGGCATIYAGERDLPAIEPEIDPDWTRFHAAAGPGWFEGPYWTNPRADLDDFYLGPDDMGDADTRSDWPDDADEAYVARAIVHFNGDG